MGNWVFEELRGAAVRRDPNEAVLFKTEQAGEGEYAGNDALVREILQNAVDARAGNDPVRVRLALHEPAGPKRTKRHVAPPIQFAKDCFHQSPEVTTQV